MSSRGGWRYWRALNRVLAGDPRSGGSRRAGRCSPPVRSAPRPGCAAALGGGGSVAPGLRRLRRRQQSVINDFRLPARSKTTASGWREQRAERPRAGALLKSSWGTAGWVPCVRVGELAARSLPRQEAAACEPLENVSQVTVSLWRIWKTPENNRAPFFAQGEAMAVNSYIGCYYPGAGGAVLALASKVTPVPKLCELPGDKTRLLVFAGRPLSKLLTSGGGVKGQLICRDKGLYESSGLHFLQIWGAIRDIWAGQHKVQGEKQASFLFCSRWFQNSPDLQYSSAWKWKQLWSLDGNKESMCSSLFNRESL